MDLSLYNIYSNLFLLFILKQSQGVLMPCLQSNMIGAILFIRLPWIVGIAGILEATVIVFLSVCSVFLTSLSLNAIVTNGKMVKAGSLYQVLRKNIGLELGGSVGLAYVLAKALVSASYCLGAAETFLVAIDKNGSFPWDVQIIALGICLCLATLMVFRNNAYYFERNSAIILVIVIIFVIGMIVGGIAFDSGAYLGDLSSIDRKIMDNIGVHSDEYHGQVYKPTFYYLLGLYYPCVSGIIGASTWTGLIFAHFVVFLICRLSAAVCA